MKKAVVIGMARSGIASARLLHQNGYAVCIGDQRSEIPGLAHALEGIPYIDGLGKDPASLLEGAALLVLSPGVSMFQPFIEAARAGGVEIIGELELGYRYAKGDFLCITGTNGKTTCTALTGELFKLSGRPTYVLGNIGTPLCQLAMETKQGDCLVLETAALQMEGNSRFHAKAAAVCNISEDHLDRFLTMEYYVQTKRKIFLNQTRADVAILNYDDAAVRAMRADTDARVLYFSRKAAVEEGVYLSGDDILYRLDGKQRRLMSRREVKIPGMHNLENAMLSAAIGLSQGVEEDVVREALATFAGVEHRIEFVAQIQGVRYINDSKGTNPDSTIKAIQAMDRPTVLLLGGYDKHSTFDTLFAQIKASPAIKAVVLLGETADKLRQYAAEAGVEQVHLVRGRFEKAVQKARELASSGDNVLLSPACASWDMFESFEERGRAFKEIVMSFARL